MENENEEIYIPVNIQTENFIFPGFGMPQLIKAAAMEIIPVLIGIAVQMIKHSAITTMFIIIGGAIACVFINTKDNTNQCMIDYISYMIRYSRRQKVYKYDSRIEVEENELIRQAQSIGEET